MCVILIFLMLLRKPTNLPLYRLQLLDTYCNYNSKLMQYHVTIATVFLCYYRLMYLVGLFYLGPSNVNTYASIPSLLDRHETPLFGV